MCFQILSSSIVWLSTKCFLHQVNLIKRLGHSASPIMPEPKAKNRRRKSPPSHRSKSESHSKPLCTETLSQGGSSHISHSVEALGSELAPFPPRLPLPLHPTPTLVQKFELLLLPMPPALITLCSCRGCINEHVCPACGPLWPLHYFLLIPTVVICNLFCLLIAYYFISYFYPLKKNYQVLL